MEKDYYKVLNIRRDADEEEIKREYRRLALKYHPDRNPENDESEEKFKEITEAYEVLGVPEKKEMYDFGNGYFGNNIFQEFANFKNRKNQNVGPNFCRFRGKGCGKRRKFK